MQYHNQSFLFIKLLKIIKIMKTNFLMLLVSVFFSFTMSVQPREKNEGPQISFQKTTIDYGKIKKDSDPLRKFHFQNTGDKALIITSAQGSCGCTVPDYPKEPIVPGASAAIDVRYDTKRVGVFTKTVTVSTNDGKQTVLTIKGEVTE
jgi:hypothetical protein